MHKWDANEYAKSSAAQQGWANDLIATLKLNGDERILDLGCGVGKISADLAGLVPQGSVVGVDKSHDMIAFANENFGNAAPNLSFQQADATDLAFNNEFDIIFSNAALHWISDHAAVLQGINRALKPGGRTVLSMGGHGNVLEAIAAMEKMIDGPMWSSYFKGFRTPYTFNEVDAYKLLLIDSGLHAKRVELVPKDMAQTPEEFTAWIRSTWHPYTQRVPEGSRETFIKVFVTAYIERCPLDAEGKVHTAAVRLEVEATK